jgi:hypothetical protein
MAAAVAGGAVSSTVYPNFAPQAAQMAAIPSMPMHRGFYVAPQPPPPEQTPEVPAIPSDAKVFYHSSDGGLRTMAGSTKSWKSEQPLQQQQPPQQQQQQLKQQQLPQQQQQPQQQVQQVPVAPPQSVAGLEDAEGHAVKIFVHDSDGVLHHIAECSQGTGGFEVDMLEDLEEDWSAEQKTSAEATPLQKISRSEGSWRGSDRHDGGREMSGLYGALVSAWNAESGREKPVNDNKSPSVASSNGSTTAESLPSPDHSGGESGDASPTAGDWSSHAHQRVRALVACGAPSLPPPPPPPIEEPQGRQEQAAKASQGSRKTGRAKGKVASSSDGILQATEARFAPSPAPVLPVARKAVPGQSTRLARAALTIVYRRIAGEVPAAPPQRGRPPQTQKGEKSEKSEKNGRQTVSRRTAACREEPRRPAPEPSEKRKEKTSAHAKHSSFFKRTKQAKNACWSRQKRRVLEFMSAVKHKVAKAKKAIAIHGKTFVLGASVVFLIITTVLCFVGESDAMRARQQRSSSVHSYASESYHESALGNRRVGAMQKRLDVESARALAATRYQSSERLDSRRVSSRQQGKQRRKQVYDYNTEAYAAWRDAYLAREQEYFKGLKDNDPELASLLEMAGSAGKYDYEDWTRMAAAYDKVMTERYGDKDGINTEDALMADRIAILMQQQLQLADMYEE